MTPRMNPAKNMKDHFLRLGANLCVSFLLFLLSSSAYAINGNVFVWPQLPNGVVAYAKQSGLQVTVDTTWIGSRGYRPVKVTLNSPTPVTGDVQVTIRFHAGYWRNQNQSISVEQDFVIPQGSSTATSTLIVPQYLNWDGFGWEIWVDGKLDKGLSPTHVGFNQSPNGNTRHAAMILPSKTFNLNPAKSFEQFSGNNTEVFLATASQLPESWIGYTNLDMVVAFPEDLQRWKKTSPKQFAELLRWLRTGGNLWIFNVGAQYDALPQLNSTLGLSPGSEDSESHPTEQFGWRPLPLRSQTQKGADALVMLEGRTKPETTNPILSEENTFQKSVDLASDSRHWFAARTYGMGTITAFRKSYAQFFSNDTSAMTAVQASLLNERMAWGVRHGNWPGTGNHEFNNLLIPDVGAAPVLEFQLLISLFILAIGPLNYWLLKRRHKLPLMLVTVPVAALGATALLFAYGILSDGFEVRVRARSFTLLDQTTGEAACWARLSYYAGLAPSKGLKLPNDTAIYPIHPSDSSFRRSQQRANREQRELERGTEQSLTRGWLASRTPTQYQTITARTTSNRLDFKQQGDGLTVTNNLGVEVQLLAVQDHEGKFFVAKAIGKGDSVSLGKTEFIPIMSQLRSLLTENIPEFPAGFINPRAGGQSWKGEFTLSQSLMESQIDSIISPLAEEWGNNSYIAITTTGPELSLGLKDAVESNSFHVVQGIWSHE